MAAERPIHSGSHGADYRIFVDEERIVLVTMWDSGVVTLAVRDHASHTWGPPIYLEEEK